MIKRHSGCPSENGGAYCFGPVGPYYTFFGSRLHHLQGHMVGALLLSLICLLWFRKMKGKRAILFCGFLLLFFSLLAWAFPQKVIY